MAHGSHDAVKLRTRGKHTLQPVTSRAVLLGQGDDDVFHLVRCEGDVELAQAPDELVEVQLRRGRDGVKRRFIHGDKLDLTLDVLAGLLVVVHHIELVATEHLVHAVLHLHCVGSRVELRVDQLLTVAILQAHNAPANAGLDPDLVGAFTKDRGVASGDGALGELVRVLTSKLGEDDLLDLVLHHEPVFLDPHPRLEPLQSGDEVVCRLCFHGCGDRTAHVRVGLALHKLPWRSKQRAQSIEPIGVPTDQRCVGGTKDVVGVGLEVCVQFGPAALILLDVAGVEVAIGRGQRGQRRPLVSSQFTVRHRCCNLAEREVALLHHTLIASLQKLQLDVIHGVTDFLVPTPLDAVLRQALNASELLLLGDGLARLLEGNVVLEPVAHLLQRALSERLKAVDLWLVGDQPPILGAEQRYVAEVAELLDLCHVEALSRVEHLVDALRLLVRDTTHLAGNGAVKDQRKAFVEPHLGSHGQVARLVEQLFQRKGAGVLPRTEVRQAQERRLELVP